MRAAADWFENAVTCGEVDLDEQLQQHQELLPQGLGE
ncbi:DUF6192 family protein [Streptomyces sp. NPDC057740]